MLLRQKPGSSLNRTSGAIQRKRIYLFSILQNIFVLLTILSLTLYSAILKERFILDIIIHGMMFGLFPFLAGFALCGEINAFGFSASLLMMIICCEALILHQVGDYNIDLGNSKTTVVKIGLKKGWQLLAIFVILSIMNLGVIAYIFDTSMLPTFCVFIYLIAYPTYKGSSSKNRGRGRGRER